MRDVVCCSHRVGPQLNYVQEAVFMRFHQISSTLCLRWPALILRLSAAAAAAVEGYEGKRKKRKMVLQVMGENLDTYRTTKWLVNMEQFCLCLWLAPSDTGLLIWRCPRVTQYDRKSGSGYGENSLPSLSGKVATMWIRSVTLNQQSLRCLPTSPQPVTFFHLPTQRNIATTNKHLWLSAMLCIHTFGGVRGVSIGSSVRVLVLIHMLSIKVLMGSWMAIWQQG